LELEVAVPSGFRALDPLQLLVAHGDVVVHRLDVLRLGEDVVVNLIEERRHAHALGPLLWGPLFETDTCQPHAAAGRLRVDVAHATNLLHAAGTGITLALAATPAEERDPWVSETMREAILAAITVPAWPKTADGGSVAAAPAIDRVAVHAVALRTLLAEAPAVLSPAERPLLNDWLDRLAAPAPVRISVNKPKPKRSRSSVPPATQASH
jgi:hypothetical protein